MTRRSIEWYSENKCELATTGLVEMFPGIYAMTGGHPCQGCNCKDTCPAWKLMQGDERRTEQTINSQQQFNTLKDGITNADIAKAMGISKRQASKLRGEGKVDINMIRKACSKK